MDAKYDTTGPHEQFDDLNEEAEPESNTSKTPALMLMNNRNRIPSEGKGSGMSLSNSRKSDKYTPRSKSNSSRVDRDAYLEVVKNKSWSNLTGFDSSRSKSPWESNTFLNILKQSVESSGKDNNSIIGKMVERRKSSNISNFESERTDNPRHRYAHYKEVLTTTTPSRKVTESNDDFDSNYLKMNRSVHSEAQVNGTTESDIYCVSEKLSANYCLEINSGSESMVTSSTQPSPHGTIIVEDDDYSQLLGPELQSSFSYNPKQIYNPRSNRTRTISFSTVEIRQYERILGDNPSCSSGAPVAIGWKFFQERTLCLPVEEYEYRNERVRDECDMILDRQEREALLIELGYSEKDLAQVVRQNVKMKKNRRQTVNNLPVMKFEETVEDVTKKLTKVFQSKRKSMYKESYNFHASATSSLSGFELKSCLKVEAQNTQQNCTDVNLE